MKVLNRPVVEVTLDEIKEAVAGYWVEAFKSESFSRDIVEESGMEPLSQWSTDAFLAFYADVELAKLVRKQVPEALVVYRKAKYDLVDLSSHIDEWEEKKLLSQLGCQGCQCGCNDLCSYAHNANKLEPVSFEDDEIPF